MSGDFNSTEQDILDYALGKDDSSAAVKPDDQTQTNDGGDDGSHEESVRQDADPNKADEDDGSGEQKPEGNREKPEDEGGKGGKEGKADKQQAQTRPQPTAEEQYRNHVTALQRNVGTLKQQLSERDRKINQLVQENEGFKTVTKNFDGLNVAELGRVSEIAALYKRDPIRAVTEFLIGAKQDGVDLTQLKLGSIDTEAIMRLIKEEVGGRIDPVVQRFSQQQRDTEAFASASHELDGFLSVYPQAEQHLDAIARIMEVSPELSLREAWVTIREYAQNNGIDLSVPPGGRASTGQQGRQASTVKALPNGGRQLAGNGTGGQAAQPRQPNAPKPVGTSLDDIIAESMREAGIAGPNYRR